MKRHDFDWDKHFATSSYSDIRNLSPELHSRRHVSSFSPDKGEYYVSPLDAIMNTSDVAELQHCLKELGDDYHSQQPQNHERLYLVQKDFEQICLLLLDLVGPDNDYGLPDKVLANKAYFQE